jgi:DNA-binding XRE family transcriptional regulator
MNDEERAAIIAENVARTEAELRNAEQKSQPLQAEKKIFVMRLVNARLKQRLSQAELAKRLGMPQPAIARIESGKGNPSLRTILAIAKALNLNLVLE